MAYRSRTVQRPVYNFAAGAASTDAGTRQFIRLLAIASIFYIDVLITGTLAVTAGGTGVQNRGSIMAAFDEIGIVENGRDRVVLDARLARYLSELAAPSALTATRATGAGVQTTVLREYVRLYFAHPFAVNPRETAFLARDPRADLQLFFKLNGTNNGVSNIIAGGTKTLTGVTVTAVQHVDEHETARPLFIPSIRQVTQGITGSGDVDVYLRPGHYVRGIALQQDTNVGEVSDIVSRLTLRGDTREIVGPEMVSLDILQRAMEYEHGGTVLAAPGYWYKNFQEGGRLANILNPRQDTNLRMTVTAAPSATAGATSSTVRIALLELERDPQAVDLNGRPLVDPIDFPV